MKVLTCNVGYLLGYENVLGGYVPPPVTSVLGDPDLERSSLERLLGVIERERPDVVVLLEVDQGSHRTATDGQLRAIRDRLAERGLSYAGEAATKYGADGPFGSLPFYEHLGNAVLTRGDRPTAAHYLEPGRKGLVLETTLASDAVVFAVHLSLGARSRRRQLEALAALVDRRVDGERVIVTGDFNTFDGPAELEGFLAAAGLELWDPGATVPERPLDSLVLASRSLDLFCCSPSLAVDRCTALADQVSDHRPVVLETVG